MALGRMLATGLAAGGLLLGGALLATIPAQAEPSTIKALDADNDGTLDLNEVTKGAQAAFDRLNNDQDDTLDRNELGPRVSADAFSAADPDKDSTLSKKEYVDITTKLFKQADVDGDGTLDAKELNSEAGRELFVDPLNVAVTLSVIVVEGPSRASRARARRGRQRAAAPGEPPAAARENAPVDALQGGDLPIELFAIRCHVGALGLAPQSADAGADREEEGAHFVVEVSPDVAALGFLHVDHAAQEVPVLSIKTRQRVRQRIDAIGDDREFRRAGARDAQLPFASFERLEALRERRDGRGRARLRLMGKGLSLAEIAHETGLSYKTIANTTALMKRKLNARTPMDLARIAFEQKLS